MVTEIKLVLEKPGIRVATYSDTSGIVFDKVYIKRDWFNGRFPPREMMLIIDYDPHERRITE